MARVVSLRLDVEAVEFALRRRRACPELTRKIQVLSYLIEVQAEYQGDFIAYGREPARAILVLLQGLFWTRLEIDERRVPGSHLWTALTSSWSDPVRVGVCRLWAERKRVLVLDVGFDAPPPNLKGNIYDLRGVREPICFRINRRSV